MNSNIAETAEPSVFGVNSRVLDDGSSSLSCAISFIVTPLIPFVSGLKHERKMAKKQKTHEMAGPNGHPV